MTSCAAASGPTPGLLEQLPRERTGEGLDLACELALFSGQVLDAASDRAQRLQTRQLLVQPGQPPLHLESSAAGPQGVVLVRLGHAEDRHHRIADELLDRAAVALDRRAHLVEIDEHQLPDRFRVKTLAHRRGAGGVAEDERRRLAPLLGLSCEG
jgi:hypothetical protein